jgi:hypothetical protein
MPIRICTFVVGLALSSAVAAQTFAVLSLVGYAMSIIQAGHSIGSNRC